ncbi:MAG: hypothetical protein IJR88_05910 [Clostridia bacterium]|nr:hypothetical protein [Clostridia bacterium]
MKKTLKLLIALALVICMATLCMLVASADCDHDFSKKVMITDPGCDTAGMVHYLCIYCDEDEGIDYYTSTIHEMILNGDYSYANVEETPATCTAPGSRRVYCKTCDSLIDEEEIEPLGHATTAYRIDFEPTADHPGQYAEYCTACGMVLNQESFETHEHTFGFECTLKEKTCTQDGEIGKYCALCGALYEIEVKEAEGHYSSAFEYYWTEIDATLEDCIGMRDVEYIAPTCTAAGSIVFRCNDCHGVINSYALEPIGHSCSALNDYMDSGDDVEDYIGYFNVDYVAPTCTEYGKISFVCDNCQEVFCSLVLEPVGHYSDSLDDYFNDPNTTLEDYAGARNVDYVAPTCTTVGSIAFRCDSCREVIRSYGLEATGHFSYALYDFENSIGAELENYIGWANVDAVPATCKETGKIEFCCDGCHEVLRSHVLETVEHDDGIWKIDFEPTPNHDGQKTRYCTVCGAVLEQVPFSAHEHTEGYKKVIKDATCTQKGATGIFCAICDAMYETEAIPALGHLDGNWKVDFEATANHDGQISQYCARCGAVLGQNIITLHEHKEGYRKLIKSVTCTEAGETGIFCSICNAQYAVETTPATGHDEGIWKVLHEATGDHDGQMAKCCSKCGKTLETKTFSAHDHTKGYDRVLKEATCTEDGERGSFCAECGSLFKTEVIPATGHDNGVWKLDFEATADHEGQLTKYCTKCGAAVESKAQKLNVGLYVCLVLVALLAVAALVIVLVKTRKKKN